MARTTRLRCSLRRPSSVPHSRLSVVSAARKRAIRGRAVLREGGRHIGGVGVAAAGGDSCRGSPSARYRRSSRLPGASVGGRGPQRNTNPHRRCRATRPRRRAPQRAGAGERALRRGVMARRKAARARLLRSRHAADDVAPRTKANSDRASACRMASKPSPNASGRSSQSSSGTSAPSGCSTPVTLRSCTTADSGGVAVDHAVQRRGAGRSSSPPTAAPGQTRRPAGGAKEPAACRRVRTRCSGALAAHPDALDLEFGGCCRAAGSPAPRCRPAMRRARCVSSVSRR